MNEDTAVLPDPDEQAHNELVETTNKVIKHGNSSFADFDDKINAAASRGTFGGVSDDTFSRTLVSNMGAEASTILYTIAHNPELEKKLASLPNAGLKLAYITKNKEAILDSAPLESMSMDAFMEDFNRRDRKQRRERW